MPTVSSPGSPWDPKDFIEAVLDVPVMATCDGRDAVLMLLPKALVSAIPRKPTARTEVVSIVLTCRNYFGGLELLRYAIKLCDGGSTGMGRLNDMGLPPDPPEDPA